MSGKTWSYERWWKSLGTKRKSKMLKEMREERRIEQGKRWEAKFRWMRGGQK